MHCSGDGLLKIAITVSGDGFTTNMPGRDLVPVLNRGAIGPYTGGSVPPRTPKPNISLKPAMTPKGGIPKGKAGAILGLLGLLGAGGTAVYSGLNSLRKDINDNVKGFRETFAAGAKSMADSAEKSQKNQSELFGQAMGLSTLGLGGLGAYGLHSTELKRRKAEADRQRIMEEGEALKALKGDELSEKLQEIGDRHTQNSRLNTSDYILPGAALAGGAGLGLLAYNKFKQPATA